MTNQPVELPLWHKDESSTSQDESSTNITNITSITTSARSASISNLPFERQNTKTCSSSRPVGKDQPDIIDLIYSEELSDSHEIKGLGNSAPAYRDWNQEIAQLEPVNQMDITYAKVSMIQKKRKSFEINLAIRNERLNQYQRVAFKMSQRRRDFFSNLDTIWGPGTRELPLFRSIATAWRDGKIHAAGKGRPLKKQSQNRQHMANLFVNSVALAQIVEDHANQTAEWKISVWHQGFCHNFYIDQEDVDQEVAEGQCIASSEYRRRERYGY